MCFIVLFAIGIWTGLRKKVFYEDLYILGDKEIGKHK